MNPIGDGARQEFPKDSSNDGTLLLPLLLALLRRKWLVVSIVFAAGLLSIIYALCLPSVYRATARVLPPESGASSSSRMLIPADSALSGLLGGLLGEGAASELYVGIMRSRSVADMLIEQFKLRDVYGTESREATYEALKNHTEVQIAEETGIILISVMGEDPKLAAGMANAYVRALGEINRTMNRTSGSRQRAFLESRLEKVQKDLQVAEERLRAFQEQHGLFAVEAQARVAIEAAATIKGEIIAAQTELAVLREFATEKQNEAVMLKSKISELLEQLARIETGAAEGEDKAGGYFIPFSRLPELGMQLAALLRETKTHEEVLKLLTAQHEIAKIEEAKDVNTVQVLDYAGVPDRTSGPARRVIVILATALGLIVACVLAVVLAYVDWLRSERAELYAEIVERLRFWTRLTGA